MKSTQEMSTANDEEIAVNKLLTCSDRVDNHERCIFIYSWDELCSWKPIAPTCMYIKPNSKNERPKSKKHFKQQLSKCSSDDNEKRSFPFRHRIKKLAHSSTNVLSYNSPSWRYIIDMKTYNYLEREHFKDLSNYVIKENSNPSLMHTYNIQIRDGVYIDENLLSNLNDHVLIYNSSGNGRRKSFKKIDYVLPTHDDKCMLSRKSLQKPYSAPVSSDDPLHRCTCLRDNENKVHHKSNAVLMKPCQVSDRYIPTKSVPEKNKNKIYDRNLTKSKTMRLPAYDQNMFKIKTVQLPPIKLPKKKPVKTPIIDQSEKNTFPFRVSGISNVNRVTRRIRKASITAYSQGPYTCGSIASYLENDKDIGLPSIKTRKRINHPDKRAENVKLPPLIGIHIAETSCDSIAT